MPSYLLTDFIHNASPALSDIVKELCAMAVKCAENLKLDPQAVRVDSLSLYAALERYARDSFGYQRIGTLINERFNRLLIGLDNGKKEELLQLQSELLDELKNSGIRIPSENPYTQKRAAFLLYHLTLLKPFYISGKADDNPSGEKKAYFNANVSAFIVNTALATCRLEFYVTKETLRDLTYRHLSRSAMEAIMRYGIRAI